MTNNTPDPNFLATLDLDTPHDLDEMLTALYNNDIIPTAIDYYYDDCHADPECYILNSPTFIATNNFNTATDDYYSRHNANRSFIFTYRMMLESIAAELADAANECASRRIIISNYLMTR